MISEIRDALFVAKEHFEPNGSPSHLNCTASATLHTTPVRTDIAFCTPPQTPRMQRQPSPDAPLDAHIVCAPRAPSLSLLFTRLPRSIASKKDFVQLTNHIQHQLAEAGRDANPISAMFDSLAHPLLDTHRGEYPSFLEWRRSGDPQVEPSRTAECKSVNSPPPTPTLGLSTMATAMRMAATERHCVSTARPHVVLGRGDVGGIWADMEQDHNQTLRYKTLCMIDYFPTIRNPTPPHEMN